MFHKKRPKKITFNQNKLTFATEDDVIRCIEIVRKELGNKDIIVNEDVLQEITEDIMDISYSKGGGYSDAIMQSFARTYVMYEMYKKFTEKKS